MDDIHSGDIVGRHEVIRNSRNDSWWEDGEGNSWLVKYADDPATNSPSQVGSLLAMSVGSRGTGEVRVLATSVRKADLDAVCLQNTTTFADLIAFGTPRR